MRTLAIFKDTFAICFKKPQGALPFEGRFLTKSGQHLSIVLNFRWTSTDIKLGCTMLKSYVDGYVIPVPAHCKEQYLKLALKMAPIFKKHGALKVVENWGDDVPEGVVTSFPMAVKRIEGEVVVFSWVIWPSKAVRDAGTQSVMAEMQKLETELDMSFMDGKRMIFGGFETIVDL
jgi:uncharacterized protein YbaA (DUF1428 family)